MMIMIYIFHIYIYIYIRRKHLHLKWQFSEISWAVHISHQLKAMPTYALWKQGLLLTVYRSYENMIDKINQELFQALVVWMPYLDANKTREVKAWWEVHKNDMLCFEQITEATSYKTSVVESLISHLTNHLSKMNKAIKVLLEKQERTHKRCSLMDSDTMSQGVKSVLSGDWMQSEGPARSDGQQG